MSPPLQPCSDAKEWKIYGFGMKEDSKGLARVGKIFKFWELKIPKKILLKMELWQKSYFKAHCFIFKLELSIYTNQHVFIKYLLCPRISGKKEKTRQIKLEKFIYCENLKFHFLIKMLYPVKLSVQWKIPKGEIYHIIVSPQAAQTISETKQLKGLSFTTK